MRLVVALGGNALGNTPDEQKKIVKTTAKALCDLVESGNELIITHGNGPQVGMINLAFDTASAADSNVPPMEFPECGAMSEGYIGYHLQNALCEELNRRNISKTAVTLITQVEVSQDDEAFSVPTKPIGSYYGKEDAAVLARERGFVFASYANGTMRRVVASPKPVDIVEKNAVTSLVEAGCIVITVGGGGIPVVKSGEGYVGVAAVIDKDYASAKVAELVNADMLVILTAVDKVSLNYGKPNQIDLDELTAIDAQRHIDDGHFGKGSMLPKVTAAVSFVNRSGKKALIADLRNIKNALDGKGGTLIC